jgi:SAM-dependent methyltransferase
MSRWRIKYSGLPLHLTLDGYTVRWGSLPRIIYAGDKIKVDGWVFNHAYGWVYLYERKRWENQYLPPYGVKDKTILDIGAGAGETAKFFLDHGAKNIIAVEINPYALPSLRRNASKHHITVIEKPFATSMLQLPHDYMKMDIEGYETSLLMDDCLEWYKKPCIVEAHNKFIIDGLTKAGFQGDETPRDFDLIHTQAKIMKRWG